MATTTVEALIVRSDREGEADRLLTLFTRELGRVLAIARGADRPKSRWAGRTRLFARVRSDLYQKRRGSGRYSFTQSHLLNAHEGIQSSLARIRAAARVCEMAASLTPLEEPQAGIWELLVETMETLDRGGDERAVVAAFQVRFLQAIGFGLHLEACAVCRRPYSGCGAAYVSAARGGIVCRRCVEDTEAPRLLSAKAMALLLSLFQGPLAGAARTGGSDRDWAALEAALDDHVRYHMDFEPKTSGWLPPDSSKTRRPRHG